MAVVQLYHHLAPKTEVHVVIKPLIRLLRFNSEVQAVVLTCIAAMSTNRKASTYLISISFVILIFAPLYKITRA